MSRQVRGGGASPANDTKPMSRQRRWQIDNRFSGKCTQCGSTPTVTAQHCETCRKKHNNWHLKKRDARATAGLCRCGRARVAARLLCVRCARRVERRRNTPRAERYLCGICGKRGHNRTTCQEAAA